MSIASIPLYNEFKYAYANGRVWSLENRLLDRERILRIIEADSVEEAVRILEGTEYPELIKNMSVDMAIERLIQDLYDLLGSFFPDKGLLKPFLLRHTLYTEGVFSSLSKEEVEGRIIEIDREIIKEKLKLVKKATGFEDVLKVEIDLINLRVFLRAGKLGRTDYFKKSFYTGGGIDMGEFLSAEAKGGVAWVFEKRYGERFKKLPDLYLISPSGFDRECENLVLEKAGELRKNLLGPESLIGYIYEKESEIRNLGIILKAKLLGIDREKVRSLIRG